LNTQNDRPVDLEPTVGRGDVDEQLAIINAFRASRGLTAVSPELLEPDPILNLDLRLTKAFELGATRRIELFLEGYNVTNYVAFTGRTGNMSSSSFLIRTGARDARQVQWGARYSF
jgi:hypothetical protein